MPSSIPISAGALEAATDRHSRLESWIRSDAALAALHQSVHGFSPEATLLKAVAVNALYYTNVVAIVRVAEHFADVLASNDLADTGPELVDRLANVRKGGTERRKVRRLSLAAKFAHFFIDEDRFPIYDKYAVRMVALHQGRSIASLERSYVNFAAAFLELAESVPMTSGFRRLDRYLWIQGQYEQWKVKKTASSRDLAEMFKQREWPIRVTAD